MFHNTTIVQDQDQDQLFWSETGLVSDHITGSMCSCRDKAAYSIG